MNYRRVMVVSELGCDIAPAIAAICAIAERPERLIVVAAPPRHRPWWRSSAAENTSAAAATAWVDDARRAAKATAAEGDADVIADLDPGAVGELVTDSEVDLVVAGPAPAAALPLVTELRKRSPVAVLWLPATPAIPRDGKIARLFCVALGSRAELSVVRFLRDHGDPALQVTASCLARATPHELSVALATAGVAASVKLVGALGAPPWRVLDDLVRGGAVDLIVLPHLPSALLRRRTAGPPVLVLPPATPVRASVQRPLDVPDLADDGGPLRVRIGSAFGVGRNPPLEDAQIAFVTSGQVAAIVTTRRGRAELPAGIRPDSLGVFRLQDRQEMDPVVAVERRVGVVRPGTARIVLFDAELAEQELEELSRAAGVDLLAVRLRPFRSCHFLRNRLRAVDLVPIVLDASTVLDEGDALDIGEDEDAVRLARVAARMLRAGFPVSAIVHRGPHPPATNGFVAVRAGEVADRPWQRESAVVKSFADRLEFATGAAAAAGNHVQVELDNATARRWLLQAIADARERVHLQTYMANDDEVGRQLEAALLQAAKRGATVRVLFDSLHGRHGSLGMRNPLIERLCARPELEVRLIRPVTGVPSLEELKRRDHRKLVVADGRIALLGGRNVAHEYYTAFGEVRLTPATPWRQVPWLDAGARVEGPAVAAIERSFHEAWMEAGGASFDIEVPPPSGSTRARVVVHRGLYDAATLEAHLALIDGARSHVYVVTGFPLLLEIQHALLRALSRGVRVRTLFGHIAPTHGTELFEGDLAKARVAATWLAHSRMDALVAAGADAYQFVVRDVPGWSADLGLVRPHVHAKALSADGQICAVGSANLDATGSYWEDEILLVVEDPSVARGFEADADRLIAQSVRVNRDDPEWQRLARRREWLHHWPGVLSI